MNEIHALSINAHLSLSSIKHGYETVELLVDVGTEDIPA